MRERIPEERLSELLDGQLSPEQAAELELQAGREPALAHDLAVWRRLGDLLDTPLDIAPPSDLTFGILNAVRADRERRDKIVRLPARLEQAIVLAGAAALAVFSAALVRAAQAPDGRALLGDAAVGAGSALGFAKTTLVTAVGSVVQLDWAVRLFQALAGVGQTAVDMSATVLVLASFVGMGFVAMGLVGIGAWTRMHGSRRGGGLGHASLFV